MKRAESTTEILKNNKFKCFLIAGGAAVALINPGLSLFTLGVAMVSQFAGGEVLKDILKLKNEKGYKKEAFLMLGSLAFSVGAHPEIGTITHQITMTAFMAGGLSLMDKLPEGSIGAAKEKMTSNIGKIREKMFGSKSDNKLDR